MFLDDLKNKKQEHEDIKKILENDYGYTVKTPVYGNSAKKTLQYVQDAKQELYRDFTIEEYNRVVLFEKYLEQLAEQAALNIQVAPGSFNPIGTPTDTIIQAKKIAEKRAAAAIKKAAEELAKRGWKGKISVLIKELGELALKIGTRHLAATGASTITGPGVLVTAALANIALLGYDAYETVKLIKDLITTPEGDKEIAAQNEKIDKLMQPPSDPRFDKFKPGEDKGLVDPTWSGSGVKRGVPGPVTPGETDEHKIDALITIRVPSGKDSEKTEIIVLPADTITKELKIDTEKWKHIDAPGIEYDPEGGAKFDDPTTDARLTVSDPRSQFGVSQQGVEIPTPMDLKPAAADIPQTGVSQQGVFTMPGAPGIEYDPEGGPGDPDRFTGTQGQGGVSQQGVSIPKIKPVEVPDTIPGVDPGPFMPPPIRTKPDIKIEPAPDIYTPAPDIYTPTPYYVPTGDPKKKEKEKPEGDKDIDKAPYERGEIRIDPDGQTNISIHPATDAATTATTTTRLGPRRPTRQTKNKDKKKPPFVPLGIGGSGFRSGHPAHPDPGIQTFGKIGGKGIWPFGKIINSSIIRRGNVMNEEATFNNLKKLLEQDLDQAELALAAKDMVVQLQDIAEDLAKMQVENLMPLVDRIKEEYGPEAGDQFNSTVEAALGGALDGIKGTHEQVQDAVLVLTGEKSAMSTDMGTGDMPLDMGDTDMDDGLGGDDISLDGEPSAAGPEDMSLGRAVKKESVVKAKRALQTALKEGKYNDKVLRKIIQSMK